MSKIIFMYSMQWTVNCESNKAHKEEFPEETKSSSGSVHIWIVPAAFWGNGIKMTHQPLTLLPWMD